MNALSPETPTLGHYLKVLRSGAWIVLISLVVTATAAYYFSSRQQKLYRATADVVLSNGNLVAELSSVSLPYVDPVRSAATQADIARTMAVARQAIRLARVKERTAGDLLANSSVTPSSTSDILRFTVTDRDPIYASALATSYALAYTKYRRALDTRSIVSAYHDAQNRLGQLKATGREGSPLYAALTEKEQQLGTMVVLQGSNASLLRSAGPAWLISSNTKRNAVLGGFFGLILGIGLAFMCDALNTRVRTIEEIEERLGIPQLARIPEPSRRYRKRNQLVMLHDPLAHETENYHLLATNLEFANIDREARSILITSARRDEGKSTVAANLAVALARTGKRVVAVDLDLRRPSLAGFFGVTPEWGLTQVLVRRCELEQALFAIPLDSVGELQGEQEGGAGSLELMPAGSIPPNPAEFIRSKALGFMLDRLGQRADLMLVDAPPLLGLSDAVTLSSTVDALIVVTRLTDLRRPLLGELRRILDSVPIAKLGFVVTGAATESTYGYGQAYGDVSHDGARSAKGEREVAR